MDGKMLLKKITAWILGLALLLCLGAAGAEEVMPNIPEFRGTLDVRPIASEEEAVAYAKEFWALDYVNMGMNLENAEYQVDDWGDEFWHVLTQTGDGYLQLSFDRDGNVIEMENILSGWPDIAHAFEEEDDDDWDDDDDDDEDDDDDDEGEHESEALVSWRTDLDKMMKYPFLKVANPAVYEEYTLLRPIVPGTVDETLAHYWGTLFDNDRAFDLYYSEYYRNETYRVKIGIQTAPYLRIVYFNVYCDASEGGNG